VDAAFLWVEGENNPMHVGSVAIFEGPPPGYGDLVRLVVAKLHLVPRYRQKVRFVPLGLGRPVWVDDPHFQILYHVRHTAVPKPGADEQLRNLAGRVLAQHLDRTKPLWEIWLVEGLRDDRWALIAKTHHCMVDGVGGVDLLSVLFDQSADAAPPDEVPWTASREPTDAELLADAFADTLRSPLTRLQALPIAARAPLPGPLESLDVWRGLVAALTRPAATPNSLNGPIGPHRRWSWVKGSLADAKEVRSVLGGTVNDVVLAAVTRGFRELILGRGEEVTGRVVRTMVPISVRGQEGRRTPGNQLSCVFPELPISVEDPIERLEEIRRQTVGLKESKQAVAAGQLAQMAGFAPALWLALTGRLAARVPQRLVQALTSNVPGPQQPLYALGKRLLDCYPYAPIGGNARVGIVVFSYAGQLNFGVAVDYDSVPDVEVLCRGVEAGIAELLQVARGRAAKPVPASRVAAGKRALRTSSRSEAGLGPQPARRPQ